MGDTGLLIDHRIRNELGDRLYAVLKSLWPVTCQTCRRALGGGQHTLAVEQFGVVAQATLHHPGCRESRWILRSTMPVTPPATVVHRTGTFLAPGNHGNPDAARAVVLLNPGLERVLLIREAPIGHWRVALNRGFETAGLVPGARLDLDRPVFGAVAVLRPRSVVITFDHPDITPYEADVDDETRQLIEARAGLLLAVTHALHPRTLAGPDAIEPVIQGDRSLMGWIELNSAHSGAAQRNWVRDRRPTRGGVHRLWLC
ncbi:hypothetical protein GCM10028799_79110 [Kribbella italica]